MPIQTVSQAFTNEGLGGFSFRNRVINGDMSIDQRNAGASLAITNNVMTYTVDRWAIFENASMAFSAQQSTTAPTGFVNSLLVTTTTAASAGSSDRSQLEQRIEGLNVGDLGWGTANAKTITLSFWIRSSLTGQFGGALQNNNGSRAYPFSFTINSANTFEYKTITIAGDTSGTWLTSNGIGLAVIFDLGMGSSLLGTAGAWSSSDFRGATGDTKLSGTLNATLYLTGVQLEVGSVATPFERRAYGMELQLCQRYFEQWDGGSAYCPVPTGHIISGPSWTFSAVPRVKKRTVPTVTLSSSSGGTVFSSYGTNSSGSTFPWSGSLLIDSGATGDVGIQVDSALTGTSAGSPGTCVHNILRANQWIRFSAEL